MEYRFGRDKSLNCGKEFCVVSDTRQHELEGHQHIVIENPQEIIHHEFDVVAELKRVEMFGECTVWYEIENHTKYVDCASKQLEKLKANQDYIAIMCDIDLGEEDEQELSDD